MSQVLAKRWEAWGKNKLKYSSDSMQAEFPFPEDNDANDEADWVSTLNLYVRTECKIDTLSMLVNS